MHNKAFPRYGDIYVLHPKTKKEILISIKNSRHLPIVGSLFCLFLFVMSLSNNSPHTMFLPRASAESPHTFGSYIPLAEAPLDSTPTPTPSLPEAEFAEPNPLSHAEGKPSTPQQIAPSLSFMQPVASYNYVSTYFSYGHPGVDLVDPAGTPVMASTDGIVIHAGWASDGYGNMIEIEHANGYHTLYAHLSEIDVTVGESVSKGAVIGRVGCTGNCTGSHLHFEIHSSQSAIDPLAFI